MAQLPVDPTLADYGEIFRQAFKASPKAYEDKLRSGLTRLQIENPPVLDMFLGSPVAGALRQVAPEKVSDTMIGQLVSSVLPEQYKQKVGDIGLGGLSADEKALYSLLRENDPELRRNSVELGQVPVRGGVGGFKEAQIPAGNVGARAAQIGGVVAADLASDGMRNIWWFLNAPQAVAQVAMFQGMNQARQKQVKEQGLSQVLHPKEAVLKRRNVRMAAAAPAWIAASMGVGNFMRQPGYKETLPSEADPTRTENVAGELANRYFLGRSGSLLPYEEFRQERPDVSRAEYNAYKNYLFSGSSPIKATADGIQGPEVTFMGKSIPLATGILPMAAAVVGARRGIKRGMAKVQEGQGYQKERIAAERYENIQRDEKASEASKERAFRAYRLRSEKNEDEVLKSVLTNTSAATAGAALSGYVLESLRRALKGRAPQEDEE